MLTVRSQWGVTTLTLDNRRQRNALTRAMIESFPRVLAAAEADAGCRCVVIRGAGSDFCSGRSMDDAIDTGQLEQYLDYDEAWASVIDALSRMAKPSVAVVRGYAVAGGFTLAMACDFVLAERDAKFGALEMRHGFPAAINMAVLAHKAGPRHALELLLSAETCGAERLREMGLVNRVAAGVKALASVEREFIAGLVALDPTAVKLTKDGLRAACNMPFADALTLGKQLNSLLMATGRIGDSGRHSTRPRSDKGGE